MSSQRLTMRQSWWILLLLVLGTPGVRSAEPDEPSSKPPESSSPAQLPRKLFRGKVVLLSQALEDRDIRVADEMDDHVVLETAGGDLIPILADWRGRAFYQDKRLRDRRVELVGMQRPGIPYLQVLMVFTFDEQDQRQYTDYWCDICSIPMYEIKPCECCQGEIRLRYQPQDLPDYLDDPESASPQAP